MAHSWGDAHNEWLSRDSTRFKSTAQPWSGVMVFVLLKTFIGMWDHRNEIVFDPKHDQTGNGIRIETENTPILSFTQ